MLTSEFQVNDIVTATELNAFEDTPISFKGVVQRVNKKTIAVSNDKGVTLTINPNDPFFKISHKRVTRP
jgi:hypothetical protein